MIVLKASAEDDPGFMSRMVPIVIGSVAAAAAEQVWIVRVDSWFDSKWLRFKGMHWPSAHWDPPDQEWVSLPPFMPTRIQEEELFQRRGVSEPYQSTKPQCALHPSRGSDRSRSSLRREGARSVVLAWFSSATATTGQGSLMVYDLTPEHPVRWYASFRRDADWSYLKGVEISSTELAYLERHGRELATKCQGPP